MSSHLEGLVDIGRLLFSFAEVNRVTLYPDGKRFESDTDHTVMLSLCAVSLAERIYRDTLDLGKISQFAVVHDLVEAYAGDTDTFGISEEGRQLKEEREYEAFLRIKKEFNGVFPWIPKTIEEYESLRTKEARFVKTVDKLMSKITHILNGGTYFKVHGMTPEMIERDYRMMFDRVAHTYGSEFPEILEIMEELIVRAVERTYPNEHGNV